MVKETGTEHLNVLLSYVSFIPDSTAADFTRCKMFPWWFPQVGRDSLFLPVQSVLFME